MRQHFNIRRTMLRNDLFHDLSAHQLAALTHCARLISFERGDWIASMGDPSDQFYILLSGEVRLTQPIPREGNVTIMTLGKNDVLGWSWLFPPYEWHLDVQALSPVDAVYFDTGCVRGLIAADHELGYQLTRRIATIMLAHLRATHDQLRELARFAPVREEI
jgi:CRP-like cAMP-binding protein